MYFNKMKYKKIIIEGRVQGVGFREFVRKRATSYGLKGYVKNVGENRLEIVVCGDENKINSLIKDCKRGPLLAHVSSCSIEDIDIDEEFDGFYIKYI